MHNQDNPKMKIMVIAGLHGEETFGLTIAGKIQQKNNPNVRVRIGHPEAISRGVRYVERDLNRSFQVDEPCVETRLAKYIEQEIRDYNPDYIIDIHTSFSNLGQVGVVMEYNEMAECVAQLLGMDSILVSSNEIIPGSLISCFPDKSIVIEFGKDFRSDELAENVAEKIVGLASKLDQPEHQLPCYQLASTIPKTYVGLADLKNMEYSQELDGYPFCAGADTYEHIGGYLAKKLR